MIFHFKDCWEACHLKARPQSHREATVSMAPLWKGDGDLSKDLRAPHLSCPHTPSLNKICMITPLETIYKLSRIIQMVLVIILRSKWDGILVLSWWHKANIGFQGAFSKFPAVGGTAAMSAFLCSSRQLSGISSPTRLWQGPWLILADTHHVSESRCLLTSGAQICFDPKWEHHFKCLILKHTTGDKTCLREECSKTQSIASTCTDVDMLPDRCTSFALLPCECC